MDPEEVFLFIVVILPLASLCFGLTLRLAIKPFVETLAGILGQTRPAQPEPPKQMAALERRIDHLTEAVEALTAKVDFDRQLVSGGAQSGEGGPVSRS